MPKVISLLKKATLKVSFDCDSVDMDNAMRAYDSIGNLLYDYNVTQEPETIDGGETYEGGELDITLAEEVIGTSYEATWDKNGGSPPEIVIDYEFDENEELDKLISKFPEGKASGRVGRTSYEAA